MLAAALVTGRLPGVGTWTVAPVVAGAVVAGALWPPARRWAGDVQARLLRGSARSPEDVVRTFGRRAGSATPDDELLVQLAESLVRTMHAASAEIWRIDETGCAATAPSSIPSRGPASLRPDQAGRSVLAGGGVVGRAWLEMWLPELLEDRPLGEVRVAPATNGGRLLGLVVVARLASGERFNVHEDASLAELGSRLGVILHNRELDATLQQTLDDLRRTNEELRASRVRLVATADSERRRIERNLHDGAQQHLVALAVNLRLAADEIAADPTTATDVFAALGTDVRDAIDELRALAHGIYPPLLRDAGLVEALRASGQRSPSRSTVRADGVGRYPTEIEAAVYFCCMEALQNAAKHAPGAAVVVLLADDGESRAVPGRRRRARASATAPCSTATGWATWSTAWWRSAGASRSAASPSGGTRIDGRIPLPGAGGRGG